MKKTVISFVALAVLILSFGGRSLAKNENVSLQKAQEIAAYFHAVSVGQSSYKFDDARLVHTIYNPITGDAASYFFNINNGGWVIVAGCNASKPIIAYAEYESLDMDNMPPAMMAWLEDYSDMIVAAQNEQVEPEDAVLKDWYELTSHNLMPMSSKATIKLISDKWGQGESYNPTYNLYCPVLWGQYCPTGCVATALSQIMHYWRFPYVGNGRVTYREPYTEEGSDVIYTRSPRIVNFSNAYYDYDIMPTQLTSSQDSVIIKNVAQLCFHVGLSVEMHYDVGGSGAVSQKVPGAMAGKFKYKMSTLKLRSQYTNDVWMDLLRNEIDNHRPVYYAGDSPTGGGSDAAGHAFICTGYVQNSTKFLFNWGWNGSGDAGRYEMSTIYGLNPLSYNFSGNQEALFGLEPPDDSNIYLGIREVVPESAAYPAYPNPACYSVTIPYTVENGAFAELQIFDMTGKQVETVRLDPMKESVEVNVVSYPKGIYVYRIKGGASHKFVVQ